MDEKIKFSELSRFFPKQQEALDASKRFKYVLFGGSVGSGKSYWIRWTAIYWLMKYYSKYNNEYRLVKFKLSTITFSLLGIVF